MKLIEERSLVFDRLTAARITANPALVKPAQATLERWLATCSPRVRPVLLEWQVALDGPRDEWLALLTVPEERAMRLRQSSPFAGVLSAAERTAILRESQHRESFAT